MGAFSKKQSDRLRTINEIFEPQEQVNEVQAILLEIAFDLAIGGQTQVYVGIGSSASLSELP